MRPNSDFPAPQKVFDKETASIIRAIHAKHLANGALFAARCMDDGLFRQESFAPANTTDQHIDQLLAESYGYGDRAEVSITANHHVMHLGHAIAGSVVAIEGHPIS